MIARLSGILVQKTFSQCVVDVHGTGYRIVVPLSTFYELPDTGSLVVLQIHTSVREDSISLYGFHTEKEREVFQLMISVSGIGPKLAVNILSGISSDDLIRAVNAGDLKKLTAIPGVGRKMAERMLLELKDKVAALGEKVLSEVAGSDRVAERMRDDALSALVNLGYKGSSAKEALDRIIENEEKPLSIDEMLKKALRVLAG